METTATTDDDSWRHLRAQILVVGSAADALFQRASLAIDAARQTVAASRDLRQRRGNRSHVPLAPDVALTQLVEWSLNLRSGLQRHAVLAEARGVLRSLPRVPLEPRPETGSDVLSLLADWAPSSLGGKGTSRSS